MAFFSRIFNVSYIIRLVNEHFTKIPQIAIASPLISTNHVQYTDLSLLGNVILLGLLRCVYFPMFITSFIVVILVRAIYSLYILYFERCHESQMKM